MPFWPVILCYFPGKNGADIVARREAGFHFPPKNETPLHDDDGNLIEDGRWDYEWDGEPSRGIGGETDEARRSRVRVRAEHPNQQRLRAMQTNDVAYANGVPGLRVEMTYDGQSRRVRKVEKSFSAQNNAWSVTSDTRYLYDGWNLIAELTVNQQSGIQNLKSTRAWGLDLSRTTTGAGGVDGLVFTALYSTTQTTANNSQPPPTSVLAPCYDGNGNVLAYCDAATGQTLGRYEYDPFGRLLLREEDPRIAGRAAHLFSTKYLDAETGLSYYGYRLYCAEWGRWLNRDLGQ